jgi:DNA-binding transcriptional MerR regulator
VEAEESMTSCGDMDRRYGIDELAELGAVSRRTVRYYVQRGLLPTPTGTGRGAHYTREHLETLTRIRQMQEAGVPLAEIALRLGRDGHEPPQPEPLPGPVPRPGWPPVPERSIWTRIRVDEGVELHVRGAAPVLSGEQLVRLEEAVRQILGLR